MMISMIVAIGRNRQIGQGNKMLWHIKEDFQHFKETTMGHTLLMGRKTFESIGRPLPGRKTVIVTRDATYSQEGCHTVTSIEEGIAWAKAQGEDELFITGGGQVYEQCLPMTEKLYLSVVDYDGEADVYFPDYTKYEWRLLSDEPKEGKIAWSLKVLQKTV